MKKYLNRILFLMTFTALIVGCEEDDVVVINQNFTTTVGLDQMDDILEDSKADEMALEVTWTQPDFGYNAAAEYNILFDISEEFSAPQVIPGGKDMADGIFEKTFTHEQLNKIMLNLGIEPGTSTAVYVKVNIILSKQYDKASEPEMFMATAYSGVLDLTTPWGVVGSATPNGWDGPDVPFYQSGETGIYVAYITMIEGEWKIRKDNDWAVNYGSADGVNLEQDGANIMGVDGTYKITFDEANLTYTIETYSWGLVGDATEFGWDKPDVPLMYDSCSDTWRTDVYLKEGKVKIRQNEDWAVNYGSDAADGTLQLNGADIAVTQGYYHVTVDFNNLTYSIEKTNVYGVVGSGYNDWGAAGPDFAFTPDFCNEGLYYANGITLLDGMIKFRANQDWAINYGDDGLDGILEAGGADIPSTAGTYDIVLDFTNPSVPTYTITPK